MISSPVEFHRFTLPIDAVPARRFAYAADDLNPAYFDDALARRAGYERAIAPPMYVCSMFDHSAGPPEHELRGDGVAPVFFPDVVARDAALMGGGQVVEFLAPVYIGDTVEVVRSLVDRYRKASRHFGTLEFVVVESRVLDEDDRLLVRVVDTLATRR